MRIIAIEAKAKVIRHRVGQGVGPTQGDQLLVPAICGGKVAIADRRVTRPRWILAIYTTVAVTAINLIGLVEAVIDPSVRRINVVRYCCAKDVVWQPRPA